jgi:multiple sugar transport system permease protein
MSEARRWVRWPAIAGGVVAVMGLIGMLVGAARAGQAARHAADVRIARAVAGYLALATPATADGRYDPAHLLSESSALSGASFWQGGLQVAWGAESVLPDRIHLRPLDSATVTRVMERGEEVRVQRPGADISIVPLLDPDLWSSAGWVAVWGAVPSGPPDPLVLALALIALLGVALTAHLARPTEGGPRRRSAWLLAAGAGLVMALRLWVNVGTVTARATRTMLESTRHLVELAATAPGVRESQLTRMTSGWRLRWLPGATPEGEDLGERESEGRREAFIVAGLRGGAALELSTTPLDGSLDLFGAEMMGWWLLLCGVLSFAVWAGRAQADRRGFRDTIGAWGFLAPAAAHLTVFTLAPIGFAVYLAFHRWGLVEPTRPFVGFANFRAVLSDGRFWHSLRVTAVYALYVPAALALALAAAVALDRSGARVRVVRTILFLPFVSSVVAVALVWQWLYQPDFGLLNAGLRSLGIEGPDWLGDPRTALPALMVMSVWVQVGYQMVLFLGGLQAIPEVYHDAARVDGAGAWQRFRWITWPLLRPTVLFVLVTGTITSFQVFTYVSVMTDGGPLYATDVMVFRIYQEAWEFLRFGTASAMSLLLLVILVALTWIQFRWLGKRVEIV